MARHETRHREALTLAETFGKRLCEAQELRGMKNEPLARATGIGLRLLQKHRSGSNLPSDENLLRYSRVLDLPVLWFFRDEEDRAA